MLPPSPVDRKVFSLTRVRRVAQPAKLLFPNFANDPSKGPQCRRRRPARRSVVDRGARRSESNWQSFRDVLSVDCPFPVIKIPSTITDEYSSSFAMLLGKLVSAWRNFSNDSLPRGQFVTDEGFLYQSRRMPFNVAFQGREVLAISLATDPLTAPLNRR